MKNILIVLILLAAVGVGGYLLMNKNTLSNDANPSITDNSSSALEEGVGGSGSDVMLPEESPVTGDEAGDAMANVREFTLDSSEFKFDKDTLTVKKGDTVKITLTNSGKMMHDWVVDEFNARTKIITNGQTDTISFAADKAGTFEYYCSVGQHRANGMVGKLIVQ